MPQGGGATTTNSTSDEETSASSQLFKQIRQGTSWSGNEQNTFFLNAGKETHFMDVSAATNFDFQDDGRGMTPLDWDGDGDLDIITSNRNAPQVRILRNDAPIGDNQFLGIRLQGSGTVNRDAIGARVTVFLKEQPPLIQTLRAGEGFQAQNTKWLHFGLGKSPSIEKLIVKWPGGEEQTFDHLQAGKRYRLVCGSKEALATQPRSVSWPSPLPELSLPEPTSGHVLTASRLPMPRLNYKSFSGSHGHFLPGRSGKITLVNLWASWCVPCLKELKEIAQSNAKLREAGIEVLALSLDGVGNQPGDSEVAKKFINKLEGPFVPGVATTEALEKITLLHDLIFEKRGAISLPTSLLVDAQGRLAGYFEGPLSVEEILDHANTARLRTQAAVLASSMPFDGEWLVAPAGFRMADYGKKLLKDGFVEDAESVYQRAKAVFQIDPSHYLFVAQLGLALENKGDPERAVDYLAQAVALKPDDAIAHAGLGGRYAKLGQFAAAIASYRTALKLDPKKSETRYNMAVLLKRLGQRKESIQHLNQVVREVPGHALAHANISAAMMEEKNLPASILHLQLALKAKPDFHPVRFQLGLLLEQAGKPDEAKAHYKQLLKVNPTFAPALKRLSELE